MASNTTHWFPSSLRVTIKHFCNININRKEYFFPWEMINNIIALSKVYVLFVEICKWYIQILKLFFRRANSRSKGRWISWLSGKSRYETMWCSTSAIALKPKGAKRQLIPSHYYGPPSAGWGAFKPGQTGCGWGVPYWL